MKILVNEMPKKKEECLFYRKEKHHKRFNETILIEECCDLNNKTCSFKNGESIFGGECRCLKVGSINT